MKISRTPDKVILTPHELDAVIKEAIRTKTGRQIQGEVGYVVESDTLGIRGPRITAVVELQDQPDVRAM